MSDARSRDLAVALERARSGNREGFDELVGLLYEDLRRIARRQLRRLRPGQTLNTTGLVNEAYLKMAGGGGFEDRAHFLHASARAMRHILVNTAERRFAKKRGEGRPADPLDEGQVAAADAQLEEVLLVGRGLERLADLEPRLTEVVECRFFAGMTQAETAAALGISERTVRRDWLRARAWLRKELADEGSVET